MEISKEFVLERLKLRSQTTEKGKIRDPYFKALHSLKEEHKELRMHVHGTDVVDYIIQLEGLENESKKKLRARLSKSNKDLFSDVLRPTDKIYSKQGGSKNYKIGQESNSEKFKDILSKIYKGQSFMSWLKSYFIDKYVIDPNGLFMIEYKDGEAWPTYKSILTIADYQQDGLQANYVIFEPKKICKDDLQIEGITPDMLENPNLKLVRVYDQKADYTYLINDKEWTISEPLEQWDNPWGKVPAVLCSDIYNTITGFKRSAISEQIELANEHLRLCSVNTLQYYHHGFAKFWKYGTPCKKCEGTGVIVVKNSQGGGALVTQQCGACRGKKVQEKEDVSDVTYISPPLSKDSPMIAPNIMGYVTPPIDSLKSLDEKVKELRDMVYHSHWGTIISRNENDKTAFEVAVNTQPMQDRLNGYTDSLENIETNLIDFLGFFYFNTSYKGCSISYGRNYVMKSEDDLYKAYTEAKNKGASYTVLNEKLINYYNAKYSNSPMLLDKALKLMQVEPFIHNTLSEVNGYRANLPDMVDQKFYYNDWLTTLKPNDILKMKVEELKESLKQYTNEQRSGTNIPSVEGNNPSED